MKLKRMGCDRIQDNGEHGSFTFTIEVDYDLAACEKGDGAIMIINFGSLGKHPAILGYQFYNKGEISEANALIEQIREECGGHYFPAAYSDQALERCPSWDTSAPVLTRNLFA